MTFHDEAGAIIAVALIALGMIGLGRLVLSIAGTSAGEGPGASFELAAGFGVAAQLMIVVGFFGAGLTATVGSVLAFGALIALARLRALRAPALVLALSLPLLAVASSYPAVMNDEFGEWLPAARFLFEHGALPDRLHFALAGHPAYPYGGALVNALGSLPLGHFVETPLRLFTVLLAGVFGLAVAATARGRFTEAPGLWWIAGGMLAATVFNPAFDPRIALTSYMDTPSGFLAGLEVLAVWRGVEAWIGGDRRGSIAWLWRGACVALAMVHCRDTNTVLIAGVALGALIAAAPALRRNPLGAFAPGAWLLALPLAGFLSWRAYCAAAGLPHDVVFRPFDTWQWNAPWIVLRALFLGRFADNPVRGGVTLLVLAAIAVGSGWVLRRGQPELRRLATIVAAMSAIWLGFLCVTYIGFFSPAEVTQALNLWRYTGELAPSILLFVAAAAGPALNRWAQQSRHRLVPGVLAAVVLAVPVVTWRHWRNDLTYPDVIAARQVTMELRQPLLDTKHLAVLATREDRVGWYAISVAYDLGRPNADVRRLVLPADAAAARVAAQAAAAGSDSVLDLRGISDGTGHPPPALYRVGAGGILDRVAAIPASPR